MTTGMQDKQNKKKERNYVISQKLQHCCHVRAARAARLFFLVQSTQLTYESFIFWGA